jgi:RND family efflux transporter MFP subunit
LATTLDLDEELSIQEGSWRGRAITFGALLLIGAFALAAGWYFFFRDEAATARATEDIPVKKMTLNTTLLISGKADAALNSNLAFQSAGRVSSVNVKVGDPVQQGQVLASLESEDLENAVASAQATQGAAQLKLEDLLDGSSAAELAAAEQAVALAQSNYTKANNDYQDLLDGVSDADLATAQQAVALAQSQLATAQSNRQKLDDSPSDADVAAAESAVAAAESSLTAAENSADNAANTRDSAEAALTGAETAFCAEDNTPSFCGARSAPISSGDRTIVENALTGAAPLPTVASGVISANSTYLNAVNAVASAEAAVTAAQDALDSAQAKLDVVEEGPSSEDVAAADAAVASAQKAVDAANAKLADVQDGPDNFQRSTASSAVASALSALDSAQAKLVEAQRGPEANAIAQARQAVRTAQLQVEAAQIRLKNAQIVAPFAGIVGSVTIQPGEFIGAASTDPPIVLLTPDRMQLQIDVGETDYSTVRIGQGGAAIFDGIPGKIYPFSISEIGLAPTVNQGVVTYPVKAEIIVLDGSPRPVPGMSARGQLTTDSKPDAIVVPPRAIRRKGTEQVVDVRRDGTVQEVVVTTGLTDPDNIEILSGLTETDVVVVPKLLSEEEKPESEPTLPGGIR